MNWEKFFAHFTLIYLPIILILVGKEINKIPFLKEGFFAACAGLLLYKLIKEVVACFK